MCRLQMDLTRTFIRLLLGLRPCVHPPATREGKVFGTWGNENCLQNFAREAPSREAF